MSEVHRRRFSALVVVVGLLVIATSFIAVGRATERAASANLNGKHTICHRTHSTSNPYRRITVSRNAVFQGNGNLKSSGHGNASHDKYLFDNLDANSDGFLTGSELTALVSALGGAAGLGSAADIDRDGVPNNGPDTGFFVPNSVNNVSFTNGTISSIRVKLPDNIFRPSFHAAFTAGQLPANQKKWGDIIPPLTPGDTSTTKQRNYSGDGVTLFASTCRPMTAVEFYTIETTQGGRSPKEVLADLQDQEANEDKALIAEIGSFTSLCPDTNNDGLCDVAPNLGTLALVSADTTPYTVANGNPVMNGVCTVGQTPFRAVFEYAPTGQLGTGNQQTVIIQAATTLPNGTDSQSYSYEITAGLTAGGTYDYRLICITDPGTDFEAELGGGTESFTQGAQPPLQMVITAPSIGPLAAGSPLPVLTGWTQNPLAGNSVAATGVTCSVLGNSYSINSLPGSTHFIECSGGSATGYVISYVGTSFSVTGSMVITAPTITVAAGASLPALTGWTQNPAAGGGVPQATNVSCSVLNNSYSQASAVGSSHDIRCSGGTAPSYSIQYVDSTFVVGPAQNQNPNQGNNNPPQSAPTTTVKRQGPPAKVTNTGGNSGGANGGGGNGNGGGSNGGPPVTDPRTGDAEPIENKVVVQVGPTLPSGGGGNSGGGGGSLRIAPQPNEPGLELLDANIEDPEYEIEVVRSGTDYNKPATWVADGFGDECWKIEPGDSSYVLPDPPVPPSGKAGAAYSLVKVKAGSLTSTDPNFQVNTLFMDPAPGSMVWPDSNKDGVFNPGGRTGDKEISHVILCVRFAGSSSTTTAAPGATTTTTRAPSTTAAPGATTTTAAPAVPTTQVPEPTGDIEIEVRKIQSFSDGSTTTTTSSGPRNRKISLVVTNGFKQSTLEIVVDLERFVMTDGNVPLPQLPKTGSSSNQPIQLALATVAFGAFLVLVRRRLRSV